MTYHFNKAFVPSHTITEQLSALKEKLWQRDQQYADTVQPMDDDDLDEVHHADNQTTS